MFHLEWPSNRRGPIKVRAGTSGACESRASEHGGFEPEIHDALQNLGDSDNSGALPFRADGAALAGLRHMPAVIRQDHWPVDAGRHLDVIFRTPLPFMHRPEIRCDNMSSGVVRLGNRLLQDAIPLERFRRTSDRGVHRRIDFRPVRAEDPQDPAVRIHVRGAGARRHPDRIRYRVPGTGDDLLETFVVESGEILVVVAMDAHGMPCGPGAVHGLRRPPFEEQRSPDAEIVEHIQDDSQTAFGR